MKEKEVKSKVRAWLFHLLAEIELKEIESANLSEGKLQTLIAIKWEEPK